MQNQRAELDLGAVNSELKFRRLLEALPVAAYTCDAAGLITYYNATAVKLWGRAPKLNDPVDRYCGSFKLWALTGAPIPHDQCWMALALRDRQEYNGHEIVIERQDGDRRTALAHANPIYDDGKRLIGAVNVLVDISERKAAEALLAQTNEVLEQRVSERTAELEALNEELNSFNYTVSHDLRGPLRGLTGFSRLLLDNYADRLDEQGREYLTRVEAAAKRMSGLIDDLLHLARLAGATLSRERVDFSMLVMDIAQELGSREPQRRVSFDIASDVAVESDRALLSIVLTNLLENAWKFTRDCAEGRIRVYAEPLEDETVFVVEDNGVGFDMEFADKLFTPFQRLHAADEFEGNGIGLATVERVVRKHGGRIWAESAPGQGARFCFTMPA